MSGITDRNSTYTKRINEALDRYPVAYKGFGAYLSSGQVEVSTRYMYIIRVLKFLEHTKFKTELTFDDFMSYIADSEYTETGEIATSSYRIGIYSALKRFNEYLYVSGRIDKFYMKDIRRPKAKESQKTIDKRATSFLNQSEINECMDLIKHDVSQYSLKNKPRKYIAALQKLVIFEILISTGMRCSALVGIDMEDFDDDFSTITVTEKGGKVRKYNIPSAFYNDILNWLACRDVILNKNKIRTSAFLVTRTGNRIVTQGVSDAVKSVTSKAIGRQMSPHKLRASYGTLLYKKTKDLYFVQQCMGHSSPKTTEVYIRDQKDISGKASSIMESIFKE